jgi:hypothetical protein
MRSSCPVLATMPGQRPKDGGVIVHEDLDDVRPTGYLVVEVPGARLTREPCPSLSTWSTAASS